MRMLIILAAGAFTLGASGAGRVSLTLGDGKVAFGAHIAQVGMTLHIKLDL